MYCLPKIFLHLATLLVVFGKSRTTSSKDADEKSDKDGYGTNWMYFPDGDDVLQRISLDMPPAEFTRRSYWMDGIEYRLYTKYNKNNYLILDDFAQPLNDTLAWILENLKKAPIKLVTHGWESSGDRSAVINIKNAYLESKDVNVIGVDWGRIANSILYPIVAMQTSKVGSSVGKFIDAISDRYMIPGSQIHLIGHSLGAHVMGNAGAATKVTIDQITGLDPARPLFEVPSMPNRVKLDSSDAQFVDVIHTCSGVFGVSNPIGHADFYPNSGAAPQPGCGEVQRIFGFRTQGHQYDKPTRRDVCVDRGTTPGIRKIKACSHSRSHYYFAESIRHPKLFPAYQCGNWTSFMNNECQDQNTFLGEYVNRSAMGTFYLVTNSFIPYGRGY